MGLATLSCAAYYWKQTLPGILLGDTILILKAE
jgi:hypothetical protein